MADTVRRWAGNPWWRFAVLLVVALILRCDTFGDPNLHDDETFYQSVGIAMHHGAIPYVDIWDRKPFGLFLIFYLIAGISSASIAYQLVATMFAAATGTIIAAIVSRWTKSSGGILAGLCYLFWLAPTQGSGGQSPIFYNLFIAAGALLLLRAEPKLKQGAIGWEAISAMALAGVAITIKTTAVFEAAFLGLCAVTSLTRARTGWVPLLSRAAILAATAAAPTLLIATGYWAAGHFSEFWHAVAVSSLRKPPPDWFSMGVRALLMACYLAPLLVLATFGLMEADRSGRRIIALWLAAAFLGLISVPRFYMHYALPMLVPLCVAAGPFLVRERLGLAATAVIAGLSFWLTPPLQFALATQSKRAIDRVATQILHHAGDGPLFVYDGPSELYHLTNRTPPTPLMFYAHLSDLAEKDVSHLSTAGEVSRVLALRPGAIVAATPIRSGPVNTETYRLVLDYTQQNCRFSTTETVYERLRSYRVRVWGDCRH